MPKLWTETIESHRRDVADAIVDAAASLVMQHGLRDTTMTSIAEEARIGRATLYKYFPDVHAILTAWHEREVAAHLDELARAKDEAETAEERLAAVLATYARLAFGSREEHGSDLVTLLHRDEHVRTARGRVHAMIRDLVAEAARSGTVRDDVPPGELASYCVHALDAASTARSKAAVDRIVAVTMAGLSGG